MRIAIAAGLVLALPLSLALGEEYPEFVQWMKDADTSSAVLRKLEKKAGPQAAGAGERLAAIYENMIGFWRQRGSAEAVNWSEEGKASALILVKAASAGEGVKADAHFKSLSATCRSCHDRHRERVAEGKYRIK